MPDFLKAYITDDNFIRGSARILYAAITQAFPAALGEIVNMSTYESMAGWTDLGATKTGANITLNHTEESFDVDQIYGEIASQPTNWELSVATAIAEMTLERLQFAWELGAITTNVTVTPNEKRVGLGLPRTFTRRRLAILHQRDNGKVRGFVLRRIQRAAQESTIGFNKTGEQQTIPVRFRGFADLPIADERERFGVIYDQV